MQFNKTLMDEFCSKAKMSSYAKIILDQVNQTVRKAANTTFTTFKYNQSHTETVTNF